MERTDRTLIILGVLLLALAAGVLVNYDRLFERRDGTRGEVVARIVEGRGDYRLKFKSELHWHPGSADVLGYDDAVFAGGDAHVRIQVGESELELEPNSLIVFRRDTSFGTKKLKPGESVFVESNGERLELSVNTKASIVIKKQGGRTRVVVKSGSTRLRRDGTITEITPAKPLVLPEAPARELVWDEPTRTTTFTQAETFGVNFRWHVRGGEKVKGEDYFRVELSPDPDFKISPVKTTVLGADHVILPVARGPLIYARVIGARGEATPIKSIQIKALGAPVIVWPITGGELASPPGGGALAFVLKLDHLEPDGKAWTEIARDAEFKDLVFNQTASVPEHRVSLAPGAYFARAKVFVDRDQAQSAWSAPVTFVIKEALDLERLVSAPVPVKITIPNAKYPEALYGAPDETVQEFLAAMEPVPTFFSALARPGYRFEVFRLGRAEAPIALQHGEFPRAWIYPGEVDLAYELRDQTKSIYKNSHRVTVELEAPGQIEATPKGNLHWTPVLFARGYEGEVRLASGATRKFTSRESSAHVDVPRNGARFSVRVRALGRGRVALTAWSGPHQFSAPAARAPTPAPERPEVEPLAATKPAPLARPRAPASATIATAVEAPSDSFLHRVGAWLWAGAGYNVVSVRQTISGLADVGYTAARGPSAYVEAGVREYHGVGALLSYSRMPGTLRFDDHQIDQQNFVWDTYSGELSVPLGWEPHAFHRIVQLALRAGAQLQHFPFVHVTPAQEVSLGRSNMTTASVGFEANTTGRFKYHLLMRYQHPLATSAEGGSAFHVSSIAQFDGSIGASYLLDKNWKAGLFAYGQLHDYKFSSTTGSVLNEGAQSLFYSAMEFRLGFDF